MVNYAWNKIYCNISPNVRKRGLELKYFYSSAKFETRKNLKIWKYSYYVLQCIIYMQYDKNWLFHSNCKEASHCCQLNEPLKLIFRFQKVHSIMNQLKKSNKQGLLASQFKQIDWRSCTAIVIRTRLENDWEGFLRRR